MRLQPFSERYIEILAGICVYISLLEGNFPISSCEAVIDLEIQDQHSSRMNQYCNSSILVSKDLNRTAPSNA